MGDDYTVTETRAPVFLNQATPAPAATPPADTTARPASPSQGSSTFERITLSLGFLNKASGSDQDSALIVEAMAKYPLESVTFGPFAVLLSGGVGYYTRSLMRSLSPEDLQKADIDIGGGSRTGNPIVASNKNVSGQTRDDTTAVLGRLGAELQTVLPFGYGRLFAGGGLYFTLLVGPGKTQDSAKVTIPPLDCSMSLDPNCKNRLQNPPSPLTFRNNPVSRDTESQVGWALEGSAGVWVKKNLALVAKLELNDSDNAAGRQLFFGAGLEGRFGSVKKQQPPPPPSAAPMDSKTIRPEGVVRTDAVSSRGGAKMSIEVVNPTDSDCFVQFMVYDKEGKAPIKGITVNTAVDNESIGKKETKKFDVSVKGPLTKGEYKILTLVVSNAEGLLASGISDKTFSVVEPALPPPPPPAPPPAPTLEKLVTPPSMKVGQAFRVEAKIANGGITKIKLLRFDDSSANITFEYGFSGFAKAAAAQFTVNRAGQYLVIIEAKGADGRQTTLTKSEPITVDRAGGRGGVRGSGTQAPLAPGGRKGEVDERLPRPKDEDETAASATAKKKAPPPPKPR